MRAGRTWSAHDWSRRLEFASQDRQTRTWLPNVVPLTDSHSARARLGYPDPAKCERVLLNANACERRVTSVALDSGRNAL